MQFAFHYKSTTTNALGWQITKVKVVANGEGGGTVDPEPEPEPGNADLFISEYVEGSSYNKYIEIYNPTNETIDLSAYAIDLNTDGGASWSKDGTGHSNYSELSGTIAAKSTIVYKIVTLKFTQDKQQFVVPSISMGMIQLVYLKWSSY